MQKLLFNEEHRTSINTPPTLLIYTICILAHCQGKGAGSQMTEEEVEGEGGCLLPHHTPGHHVEGGEEPQPLL